MSKWSRLKWRVRTFPKRWKLRLQMVRLKIELAKLNVESRYLSWSIRRDERKIHVAESREFVEGDDDEQ